MTGGTRKQSALPSHSEIGSDKRIYRHLSEFASLSMNFERLSQFCVLGLCSDQDWNIRVSVLPKREEILIRRSGFGCVAR